MWRILVPLLLVFTAGVSSEESESSIRLLDNRFRVDPSISQVSFIVYRKLNSQSVVLVRPDGQKYYAWNHPENVRWYEESGMDIISIDNPMPGPWQAVGQVHPSNNIKILSNLKLDVDRFPQRLYMGESIKFTAQLKYNNKPLVLRDFLDRVNLKVTFTKYVANEESLSSDARPTPQVMGEFEDDGQRLDEYPGDGVFTVELPIQIEPGKYRARITSGNGIFLRSIEQTILVYPTPLSAEFVQARSESMSHSITIKGEEGTIKPGSIAVSINQTTPEGKEMITQGQAEEDGLKVYFGLPNAAMPGKHTWSGMAYTTEAATGRELTFYFAEQSFSVVEKVDVEASVQAFKQAQEEKRMLEEQAIRAQEREDERFKGMMIIMIGNLIAIILGIVVWFVVRKIRMKKEQVPEMQLSMPPKG
ncbi:TIGR03503 family protein [Vibrio sp. S9_S30]|uniref:TIGR03503 family protein n=1 Tax=Vibrio sp. S9_S30 TaxID=2720226 RepID=UPI001680E03F|nr:TIGR03503 family protein [Vibrio sp. S9_S30]MBD1555988.1 TIGR03503 family protein [Vibrio sp. S9_S30]